MTVTRQITGEAPRARGYSPANAFALCTALLIIAALAMFQSLRDDSPPPSFPAPPSSLAAARDIGGPAEPFHLTVYLVGSAEQYEAVSRGMAELHSSFIVLELESALDEALYGAELQALAEGGYVTTEIIDLRAR